MRKHGFALTALAVTHMLLSGCATTAPIVSDYCRVFQPILTFCSAKGCDTYEVGHDYFTHQTAVEIDGANNAWAKLCK